MFLLNKLKLGNRKKDKVSPVSSSSSNNNENQKEKLQNSSTSTTTTTNNNNNNNNNNNESNDNQNISGENNSNSNSNNNDNNKKNKKNNDNSNNDNNDQENEDHDENDSIPFDKKMLLHYINSSVIGADAVIEGPFGKRKITYADYTASGRSLKFIEEYIVDEILPFYANSHTEASATGLQSTQLREDARCMIKKYLNASDDDVCIFTGTGATGAINHLAMAMGFFVPDQYKTLLLSQLQNNDTNDPQHAKDLPVVFIGPYEHHSNELPWREGLCETVVIHEDCHGVIDLNDLRTKLQEYRHRTVKIGSFSAASNVTGVRTDVSAIAQMLHEYDAYAFFDYAGAGPYVKIDMNPGLSTGNRFDYLDAVFLSPHKFIGGPGTPGILMAKRHLFAHQRRPVRPGGGTVFYVSPEHYSYTHSIEEREEGGTPDIIGSIRAALVFQLKSSLGERCVEHLESRYVRRALQRWGQHPNIHILGPGPDINRISIVSFCIRHRELELHYNFVVALLNDLFGIQSRGGCSCAGPYGHHLLGIEEATAREIDAELMKGHEGIRPGWVRVNFNYFISEREFEYILSAVEMIADYGHRLLKNYWLDDQSGLWHYIHREDHYSHSMNDIDTNNNNNNNNNDNNNENSKKKKKKQNKKITNYDLSHNNNPYKINNNSNNDRSSYRWRSYQTPRIRLTDISYENGRMDYVSSIGGRETPAVLDQYLSWASHIFEHASDRLPMEQIGDGSSSTSSGMHQQRRFFSDEYERLRRFHHGAELFIADKDIVEEERNDVSLNNLHLFDQ